MSNKVNDIHWEIEKLIQYSIHKELVEQEDEILVRNFVLDAIGIDDYTFFDEREKKKAKSEMSLVNYPVNELQKIVEWAGDNGKLKMNTVTFQDILNAKIMGQIVPRTSLIRKKFWELYNEKGYKVAMDYFYELSKQSNYIRTDRINKNVHWYYNGKYEELELTINLSKPEKDPKEIAMAKNNKMTSYPKGLLSKENEGYGGRVDHPARQNHRLIELQLDNESWLLQYSPYTYYNEHCIVFSNNERPMKIDKNTFARLFDFVKKFPHYFIGSNADLPIVGGSILSHDHFQGGNHTFPMEKAKKRFDISFSGFDDVEAFVVDWPMSAVRLQSKNINELINLSDKILQKWIVYNDDSLGILSHTKGERHNTITPIARYKKENDIYEIDLVLRNNRTTDEYPLGIYHPHNELHNIKKENIGLIEVMGIAVLPGRLKEEMSIISEEIVQLLKDYSEFNKEKFILDILRKVSDNQKVVKHVDWLEYYFEHYKYIDNLLCEDILNIDRNYINNMLNTFIGDTFERVLVDSGVFKDDDKGNEGIKKFVKFCSEN